MAGFLVFTVNAANAAPPSEDTAAVMAAADRAAVSARADRYARTPVVPPAPVAAATEAAKKVPAKKAPAKKAQRKAPAKRKAPARPAWVKPMASYHLTSCYEYRTDPYPQFHRGIDFANAAGTRIQSVHSGKVIMAGDAGDGYGNKVVVNHRNGTYALYGHASRVAVKVGQSVVAGQTVAYEGSTGDSTGPHLHFEIWKGSEWNRVNPAKFLRAMGVKVGC
jgi:murein DD-endopeptidase MepM/ murein hydrolase activator NlpD